MTNNNFNILDIINKASAKDRAIIYFDELFNMSILCKRKFTDDEMEALYSSFKTNAENNMFNSLLCRCAYLNLLISQIDHVLTKVELMQAHSRYYFSILDNKYSIEAIISNAARDAKKGGLLADKKVITKMCNSIVKQINDFCLTVVSDKVVKDMVEELYQQSWDGEDQDFYEEKLQQYFDECIDVKATEASATLDLLKKHYNDSGAKFEVVDDKIESVERKIKNVKSSLLKEVAN